MRATHLFVVWVNNADLYYPALAPAAQTWHQWTNAINQSQTNHYKAITNLYAKGVRTLIMPNAVDISTIPQFNTSPATTNLHSSRRLDYNAAFANTLNRVRAIVSRPDDLFPGLFHPAHQRAGASRQLRCDQCSYRTDSALMRLMILH